jgi:hypothetical protein
MKEGCGPRLDSPRAGLPERSSFPDSAGIRPPRCVSLWPPETLKPWGTQIFTPSLVAGRKSQLKIASVEIRSCRQ